MRPKSGPDIALGRLEHARAVSRASFSPSKIRGTADVAGPCGSRRHRALLPPIACAPERYWKRWFLQSLDDPAVAPTFAIVRDVRLQQDARLQKPLRRGSGPCRSSLQADDVLPRSTAQRFTKSAFAAIISSIPRIAMIRNWTIPLESLKRATSRRARQSAEQSAPSRMADGWTATVSPSPVRALRGHTEGDPRRLREQMPNPVLERLVGVCHPFTLMHQLEPGLDRECLYEAPDIGDVS